MKTFVNKHTTLLFALALMPIGAFLYVISKGIFDYLNLTILLIQIGLFLIQLTAFILLYFVSDEYKILFKNPFKRLLFWVRALNYKPYYYRVGDYGECLQECPIKIKSEYGFTRMVGSVGCKEDCKNCIASEHFTNNSYIKCKYVSEKKIAPLNWLKKLFGILVIALLFSSCSVYVNCNFNKVPKYKTTQQDSTVLQINEYWF